MTNATFSPQVIPPPHASTCLEIDLGQIKQNYRILRQKSQKSCAAVVKANGYGLGAGPIAKALFEEGCRHFFVATVGEGIALRETYSLPRQADIYIFNGVLEKTEDLFEHHHLTPTLLSLEQIERWAKFAKSRDKKLPAIVHIDTGMARTGLPESEQKKLRENPNLLNPFDVHYIMSHLACASTLEHPQNANQLEKFTQFVQHFPGHKYSLSASGGIALGPNYHFDLTRPGLGLYGAKTILPECKLVARLWVRIIQIRHVLQDDFVGYEASYQCDTPQRLATLSIGYADGWSRPTDKQVGLSLQGQQIPLRGRSSMDLLIADVTDFPENSVQVGDWVQLLGPDMPIRQAAEISHTTPYQILTSLGQGRHHRVYLKGARE
ncbi:MAG: alanine racemase [bacterium]|nr:alanine racemase [bacterium]